jgi:serine/threonine-protein kinase
MRELGQSGGRYQIAEMIGAGGTADIWKVQHTWLLSTHVLKHLRLSKPEFRYKLIEEGRIQAVQDHENLVTVTDAFEIDGRPALVMEYIKGPTLAAWIDQYEKPPLEEAIGIFRGVVRGMYAAHRVGLVHRDLKPENVFLKPDPLGFIPKVGDFGLAKVLTKGRDSMTLSGMYKMIGTPEYMAPEQIENPGLVDARADIFSLGALLYEMITGSLAFDAELVEDVVGLVLDGKYTPVLELRPEVHPQLVALVDHLLKFDRNERPKSCLSILRGLDRIPHITVSHGA